MIILLKYQHGYYIYHLTVITVGDKSIIFNLLHHSIMVKLDVKSYPRWGHNIAHP